MSMVSPLSNNISRLLNTDPVRSTQSDTTLAGGFSNILSEAMETAALTDQQDKTSALELLTGQADDMSGLLLDAEKAEMALSLALQIRLKLLEAYNELTSMQV